MKIKTFSVNHYNKMGWGTKISRADHYFRKNWSGGNKIFNEKIGPQDQNYRDQNSSDSPTLPHSKVGMMAELNKHVTQMIVASDDTRFTGQGGGD